MTKVSDAVQQAGAYLSATENTVQSYRILSAENRARLQQWFPTLTTALGLQSALYAKVFTDPTPPNAPPNG